MKQLIALINLLSICKINDAYTEDAIMKIGFLFPGYSSQYVGMAKELYDEYRVMQEYFEEASNCLPINFIKLCFASSDIELGKIENAYPSIFLTSLSIAQILKEQGIIPDLVAGLDIGELTAISFAEGVSFPDGLYLLSKYAQLYKEALDNWQVKSLVIEGITALELEAICQEVSGPHSFATIAVYLDAKKQVVTGHEKSVQLVEERALNAGALIKNYPTQSGLHNRLMDPIVMYLKKYLEKIDFKDTIIPVVFSVDGTIYTKKDDVEHCFIKQLQTPLYWDKVLRHYNEMDIIVQVGPGKSLVDLTAKIYPQKTIIALNKPSDIEELHALIKAYKKDE